MNTIPLSMLKRGRRARIHGIRGNDALLAKLLAMGVEEGQEISILHEGLLGRDPLAIRLNDRIIALRRRDAAHVAVEPIGN